MEVFIILWGLFNGSLLNSFIYRIPRGVSLFTSRIDSVHCAGHFPLGYYIPLFNFLFRRNACFGCGKAIPASYPLVESITALLTLLTYSKFGFSSLFFFYIIFIYFLIVISFIDIEVQLIHNKVLIILLISGILINILTNILPWKDSLLGLMTGGAVMLSIGVLGKIIFGKETLGMGDVKFMAVAGFFLGWKVIIYPLFLSFMIALLVIIGLMPFYRYRFGEVIPLAPFLAVSLIIFVYWGTELVNWYWEFVTIHLL